MIDPGFSELSIRESLRRKEAPRHFLRIQRGSTSELGESRFFVLLILLGGIHVGPRQSALLLRSNVASQPCGEFFRSLSVERSRRGSGGGRCYAARATLTKKREGG